MNQKVCHLYPMDESLVPVYPLPDPLITENKTQINSAAAWMNHQRNHILSILKEYCYGEILPRPDNMSFELLNQKDNALDGLAIRKEIKITLAMNNGKTHSMVLLLYLPKSTKGPVPAFLALNFKGNHNTTGEDDVIRTGFIRSGELAEPKRNIQTERFSYREVIQRGYASATICYHDIHPDITEATDRSVFHLFFEPEEYAIIPEKYSVIGAWAWGLSRGLDCLQNEPAIDQNAIIVHGHSRLGKTALWAGATDQRFAMVISNDSGCGGGALHRRKFGENLSLHFDYHIANKVPCWFVKKLANYIWKEEDLPFDQHELLAMAAPRPLVIGTSEDDHSADPHGEFAAAVQASRIYKLFGSEGLPVKEMPEIDRDITGDISFHCRPGGHDQKLRDWQHYLDIADTYFKAK